MNANLLEIKSRKRQNPLAPADPSDFEFEQGNAVDPKIVVTNPLISLYCLDHANQRALFVETSPGVDLSQVPFFYQAQYENTVNLIGVPYETLNKLASEISFDSNQLILIYSVGRAGSTLLGSALNAVDGIVGISEPDVFTQLVMFRDFGGSNDIEISKLVESCIKLQCKPTEQISNPIAWAIKFRSFSIELGDLLYKHFPHTKNIFIYRNAESWTTSTMRAFVENEHNVEFRTFMQGFLSTMVPPIAKHVKSGGELLTFSTIGAMMWLRVMERYMELHEKGMPGLAVRYEDLKAAPQETMKKIVDYCGFSNVNIETVYQVLAKDSQAGSAISQENLGQKNFEMTDAHRADLTRVLQAHPVINSPDFRVPTI
ncbi:MAG: sulfotransferase [Anaerolineales bacterium]|nr:sulfotransferase [Anaerolineales bacterium]